MEIILGIATLLGGVTAAWFLWEKYSAPQPVSIVEEEKIIKSSTWEKMDLKKELEENGYNFRWSNEDAVEGRVIEGFEVIYQDVPDQNKRYKFVNKSGQILIGRQNT